MKLEPNPLHTTLPQKRFGFMLKRNSLPVAKATMGFTVRDDSNKSRNVTSVLIIALIFLVMSAPADAADNIFGNTSPLTRITDFISGPFAYSVVVISIVIMGAIWVMGGDFAGIGRRLPVMVVAGALIIFATSVVGTLFSGGKSFEVPATLQPSTPQRIYHETQ